MASLLQTMGWPVWVVQQFVPVILASLAFHVLRGENNVYSLAKTFLSLYLASTSIYALFIVVSNVLLLMRRGLLAVV